MLYVYVYNGWMRHIPVIFSTSKELTVWVVQAVSHRDKTKSKQNEARKRGLLIDRCDTTLPKKLRRRFTFMNCIA